MISGWRFFDEHGSFQSDLPLLRNVHMNFLSTDTLLTLGTRGNWVGLDESETEG